MTRVSETLHGRSLSITLALAIAVALACMFLAGALWNPVAGAPLAVIFLTAAWGIHKRRVWSAYGAALLLAALAVVMIGAVLRAPRPEASAIGIITAMGIFGLAVLALFWGGRRMPAGSARGSRSAWIVLAALVVIFPQVCRAYLIGSGSMEDTILTGDQILVCPLTGAPARGDLVQLRSPLDRRQSFLKRVVATGGDHVRLRNKQLIVNGTPVSEPYAIHQTNYIDDFRDNFPGEPNTGLPAAGWRDELHARTVNGELVVPPGRYFVLGDNRDNSLDSRYFGFLDRSDLTGKPVLVYFSTDSTARAPVLLHPSHIRWARLFKGL